MLKKSLPTNYRRKLARVILPSDGTELVTLRDAANLLLDVLGSAKARSGTQQRNPVARALMHQTERGSTTAR